MHLENHIESKTNAMQSKRNIGMFSSILEPLTKASIYKCMVRPMLLYGSELLLCNVGHVEKIQQAETALHKKAN